MARSGRTHHLLALQDAKLFCCELAHNAICAGCAISARCGRVSHSVVVKIQKEVTAALEPESYMFCSFPVFSSLKMEALEGETFGGRECCFSLYVGMLCHFFDNLPLRNLVPLRNLEVLAPQKIHC